MKNLANILTGSRIVLSIVLLLFFKDVTVSFLIIYTIAEFTDMIDGTVARMTNSTSSTGALLDSIADFLLSANLIKIIFYYKLMSRRLTAWLIIALGIGCLSPFVNYIKHKKVFFIHSIPCKILGGLSLVVPFAVYFGFIEQYLLFMLTLLTYCMIELLVISILMKEPNPNEKSIVSVIRANRAQLNSPQ